LDTYEYKHIITYYVWWILEDESGQFVSHIDHPRVTTSNAALTNGSFFNSLKNRA